MKRLILFSILILLTASVFAETDLLYSSIQNSSYEELKRMGKAYSLNVDVGEKELRKALIEYFGLSDDASDEGKVFEKSSSITIENADKMTTLDDVVVIEGNVVMTFNDGGTSRSIKSSRVVVDLENKLLEACGNVVLDDSKDEKTFSGQVVCLNWESLDVKVFDGVSSTERKNAKGSAVELYATGESIAYSGDEGTVFFNEGLIATTSLDPYWSIKAKKLALMDSDLFVDNAVFKLGRVPVLYFPLFFYPGTTLSFNPAIGLSSSKGAFINTTYEVYGKYPKIGKKASASKEDDSEDVSASVFALMSNKGTGEMVRDGLYYRPIEEVELSDVEKWARSSNSYLAVFSDAYEELGLVLGYDTYNSFKNGKLIISSLGAFNYKANPVGIQNRMRYAFDFSLKAKFDKVTFNLSAPTLSDPEAKEDLLNRNTVFGIDSILGKEQNFPNTYSSVTNYSWSADASGSWSSSNYRFSIDSLKATIDFKLDDSDNDGIYVSKIKSASFPYVGISSSGTFFEKKGKSSTVQQLDYTNELASEFADEQSRIEKPEATDDANKRESTFSGLKPYDGPNVKLEKKTSTSGSVKSGYTFRQTIDDKYVENLKKDDFYTKVSGTVFLNASSPDSWVSVEETVKPSFNFTRDPINETSANDTSDLSMKSTFVAKSNVLGLTYRLSSDIYNYYHKRTATSDTVTKGWGEWDKKHVTEHSLEFRKSFSGFTFSIKETFKPVKETLKPAIAFSKNGFTSSVDMSYEKPEEIFEKVRGNLNVGYSNSTFSFSLNNSYDFKKSQSDVWAGYTLSQRASAKLFKNSLSLTESFTLKNKFVPESLSLSAVHSLNLEKLTAKTSMSYSMKGEELESDLFKVSMDYSLKPVYLWKNRIGFDSSLSLSFTYDFKNPYSASFTSNFKFGFVIAEFTDISFSVGSANKSFFKYYDDGGNFSVPKMLEDLSKSFDFFGTGRRNTSFNLSSYSIELVHYMRDWTLTLQSVGKLSNANGRMMWIPEMTVCVQWIAIPELKTENTWKREGERWN